MRKRFRRTARALSLDRVTKAVCVPCLSLRERRVDAEQRRPFTWGLVFLCFYSSRHVVVSMSKHGGMLVFLEIF